ncbi:MAG: hypothetical protein J0H08_12085, partial [Rhizobiales bacterium]|nr:hypothetical protein [Hyphomicrobiales bacterium]
QPYGPMRVLAAVLAEARRITLDVAGIKRSVGVEGRGEEGRDAVIRPDQLALGRGDGDRAMKLFSMLNPITHAASAAAAQAYKVEPYVVAADVYAAPGHVGRGGWTWYTGSAGWLYRCGLEALLGIRKTGDRLAIRPAIPTSWQGFGARYRFGRTIYAITVKRVGGNSSPVPALMVDGELVDHDSGVALTDDGGEHHVVVWI